MIFVILLRAFDLEVHGDRDDPGQGKYYIPWLGSLSCGGGNMSVCGRRPQLIFTPHCHRVKAFLFHITNMWSFCWQPLRIHELSHSWDTCYDCHINVSYHMIRCQGFLANVTVNLTCCDLIGKVSNTNTLTFIWQLGLRLGSVNS